MAKKNVDGLEMDEVSEVETVVQKPDMIATEFGREDMNKLRDAVNYLLARQDA